MIDKVISELDFAIKLMTVPPKGNRGNPGEQYQSVDNELSTKDTKEISTFGMGIDSPKRMYDKFTYRGKTDSTFIGYEKSYIMVDFIVT